MHDVNGRAKDWGTPSCGQSEKHFDYAHIDCLLAIGIERELVDNAELVRARAREPAPLPHGVDASAHRRMPAQPGAPIAAMRIDA
jgi:hypothetical protein